MKIWHTGPKVLVVILSFFMAFPCGVISAAAATATTQVKHKPPGYYLPGFRIILDAEIKDQTGVQVARCYFKTKKEKNFVFTNMAAKGNPTYQATLPAPWVNSESIDYVFVAVNEDKQVVRTQVFSIKEKETEQAAAWREAGEVQELRLDAPQEVLEQYEAVKNDLREEYGNRLPEWQLAEGLEELAVLTEFEEPSAQLKGFYDNMVVTTVPSASKYGVLAAGLYTEEEIAAVGGKAAAASATGASTAGTISAAEGGIGMGTLALGAAVVAVGAVAIGSSGGGSSGGGSIASGVDVNGASARDFVGSYSVIDPNRTFDDYHAQFTLNEGGTGSSTEYLIDPDRNNVVITSNLNWTFDPNTNTLSMNDILGGGSASGVLSGTTNNFRLTGVYASGAPATLIFTR